MANLDLSKYGITDVKEILHNPSYEVLFEEETKDSLEGYEKGQVTELGAVNVMTGIYTGRSPKDKFFVYNEASKDTVWWTSDEYKNDNKPCSEEAWADLKAKAVKQLSGKRLCVPRCLPGNDGRMELVEITSLNDLQPGRYGILEPCGGRTIAALEPGALALIPCLAVDKQGVRLGRGAGYYDRFLTRFGQTGPKLLLCPEALVFPALPTDEWDVPFTPGEILTENGVK